MKPKLPVATILVIIAAFLAPVLGGYVNYFNTDASTIAPGLAGAILGIFGPDAPVTAHCIVTLLVVVAMVAMLAKRRISQVPNNTVSVLLILFFGVLGCSLSWSSFRSVSTVAFLDWLAYGVAFYATIATVGRKRGPLAVLAAIFLGCVVISLFGISEYAQTRWSDPTWRIFAHWINPNATAAMLLVGFFCGLGLVFTRSRLEAMGAVAGCTMILFAMFLTGSKGALLLALPIGISVFAASNVRSMAKWALFAAGGLIAVVSIIASLCFLKGIGFAGTLCAVALSLILLFLTSPTDRKTIYCGRLAAVLVCASALVMLLSVTSPKTATGQAPNAPFSRVTDASKTQDQSSTFRLLLWKSATKIALGNPTGYGLGAYSFESSRPGLTTPTVFAHNSFLQLWAETSLLGPGLLIAAIIVWLGKVNRNARSLEPDQMALKAAATAAVISVLIHSMVDSDLYYFGIGFSVFVLMAVALLLATDAVAPEYVPKPLRMSSMAMLGALSVVFLFFSWIEVSKAQVRLALMNRDSSATETLATLRSVAPFDGDVWHLSAQAGAGGDAIQNLASYAPAVKNLRSLANEEIAKGNFGAALLTLNLALQRDPNNLKALRLQRDVYLAQNNQPKAVETAQRMVAVEDTDYFKVRSIEQLIPTESFDARIFLASLEPSLPKKAALLEGAVKGYQMYAKMTAGDILFNAKKDRSYRLGDDTATEVPPKLQVAKNAALELAKTYRAMGDAGKAVAAEADGLGFDTVAAGFNDFK